MKVHRKLAVAAVTMCMGFVPAIAVAHGPGTHGNGSNATSNAKKYGKYCQGESKQHVSGQKGTPFADCVKAMAQLSNGSATNPKKACATESRKHVTGQKGTPYSQCISGAAKLKKADSQSGSSSGSASSTSSS